MGDMADYYREQEWLDEDFFEPEEEDEGDFTVWRTKDGRRTPVRAMTSDHLRHTIQVLRGKSPHGTTWRGRATSRIRWVQVMADELQRRGEPLPSVHALPST